MGEHHVIFSLLLILGSREARKKGGSDRFFSLFPLLWVGQQWEGMVIFFYKKKIIGWVGGRLRFIEKSLVLQTLKFCHKVLRNP